jgi:hypothetical protein
MVEMLFNAGDRVRARVSTTFVEAEAEGTVCAWYPVMPEAYVVQFDGQQQSWMMWADELEPVYKLTAKDASHQ